MHITTTMVDYRDAKFISTNRKKKPANAVSTRPVFFVLF